MMRPKKFNLIFFVAAILLTTLVFHESDAAGATAPQFIQQLASEVRQTLVKRDFKGANRLFLKYFDMERFGRRCLKDRWDEFDPNERSRYLTLFKQNLEKRIEDQPLLKKNETKFVIKTTGAFRDEGGDLKINSRISTKKGNFLVSFILIKSGDAFRIADMEVEGALLSRQYRSQFNHILRKDTKEAFLKRLEDKLKG